MFSESFYLSVSQQRWVDHLGDLQNCGVKRVLHHDGAEAFVEAHGALLTPNSINTVPHSFILRINGQHFETQVSVVDDSARSLDMQPVQHCFQRKQQHICAQAASKAGHELREVCIQHRLDRVRLRIRGRVLWWAVIPMPQQIKNQPLHAGTDYIVEDAMENRGKHQVPEGKETLAVRYSHSHYTPDTLFHTVQDAGVVSDYFTLVRVKEKAENEVGLGDITTIIKKISVFYSCLTKSQYIYVYMLNVYF